ncbi:MAG TPA: hypothetical protein VM598_09750, partial [Bdellovibrionota bacterium]|nr:hypothetical protein [Bdellovibrionota bacterium]
MAFGAPPAEAYDLRELLSNRLDPDADYRTLRTEHFAVHFPAELADAAPGVARTAEKVHERLSLALGSSPQATTHIVLVHRSDEPGIFTFVHPHSQIFFDISLPPLSRGLNDYQAWQDWLLTHEYTHVIHMDMRGGAFGWLSKVFGSWVRPGMTSPPWLSEGLAVHAESTLTPKGRGGSSSYAMMMRVAHAEGVLDSPRFVAKDTIAAFDDKNWPWSVRPYLFGYFLVRTVAEKSPDAVPKLLAALSSSFPYDLDGPLRAAGFASFDELWERTMARIREDAERSLVELRTRPFTPLEYLTETGHLHHGLAISPDGRSLVVTRDRPEVENMILRFSLDGDRWSPPVELQPRGTGYQSGFSRSSRFLVFDETSRAARHYLMSDICIYDLKTSKLVSVSPYLRARDPDVHPDGKHVVFVKNEAGRNELWMTDTAWQNPVRLLGAVGNRRISGPRFSPDGETVAVSVHNESTGGEDLWMIRGGKAEILLADGAENTAVHWTPDGKRLLFSSDRTGVANIHAIDLEKRKHYRLTHVLGGLTFPVVDPALRWVYAVSYRSTGYDVARFRYSPESWVEIGPVRPVTAEVGPSPASEESSVQVVGEKYSGLRYQAPQYLRPSLLAQPNSFQFGAEAAAIDPLFFHH